jgi:hypothetical protein
MKQETIEETADKYVAKNKMYFDTPYEKAHSRVAFIAGAKWQAERMYSEEEVIKLFKKIIKYDAKWQQELKQEIENL